MLSLYESEKTLPKEVFQIGDIYVEVDNTEKARALYQQVLDEWPESEYVFNAEAGFIKADIHDGYDEAAMLGIETLIEEYKDNYNLPRTVLLFGEQYWDFALVENSNLPHDRKVKKTEDEKASEREKMIDYYSKALTVWEIVINEFSESQLMYDAYRMAGEAARFSRQYQKAVEYYRAYQEKWPDDNRAVLAQFNLCNSYNAMLHRGIIPENEAYETMKKEYEIMVQKYPDSPLCSGVNANIKEYERKITPKKHKSMEEISELIRIQKSKQGGK